MHKSRIDVSVPNNITVAEYVIQTFNQFDGSRVAMIDAHTDRQYTFAEVTQRIKTAGSALRKRGLRHGDVICFFCTNSLDYVPLILAVTSTGAAATPANPEYTVDELVRQVKDTNAQYLMVDEERIKKAVQVAERVGNIKEIFVVGVGRSVHRSMTSVATLYEDSGDQFQFASVDPVNDLFLLPTSSGTTGLPKSIMLTHYNFLHNIRSLSAPQSRIFSSYGDMTVLIFLPQYHLFGFFYTFMSWCTGSTMVLLTKFDINKFLAAIQKYKVSHVPIVPPIAVILAKDPRVFNYDLSSLTDMTCAAASLRQETAEEIAKRMKVNIRQMYALTEESGIGTLSPVNNWKHGSSGILNPVVESQIVDPASGRVLGTNEIGEVWLRSTANMKGYLNNEKATRETIDSRGWLHTGDLGYFDKDEHLFITGRIKELIKYMAFQVSPVELEAALLEHPAVADVAVVGIPDAVAGEVPRAIVVKKDGQTVSEKDIVDYMKEKVSSHKWLRGGVEFVTSVPKSPAGKILRQVILAQQRAKLQQATSPASASKL